jgi:hypothetical protein
VPGPARTARPAAGAGAAGTAGTHDRFDLDDGRRSDALTTRSDAASIDGVNQVRSSIDMTSELLLT